MKKYKIHICAFIFSIIIFIVGNITVDLYEKGEIERKRNDVTAEGNEIANSISDYINTALSITYTLSYMVAQAGGIEDPGFIIEDVMKNYGVSYTIELAPKGIVKNIYPDTKENRVFIGRNLFQYQTSLKNEGNSVELSKDLYVSNILTLFSGEKGMIVRAPVYLKKDDKEEFWGFVNCIIRESEIKSLVNKDFQDKYQYKIYSLDKNKQEKSQVLTNIKNDIKVPENIPINFPNNQWILSIDKETILGPVTFLGIGRVITILVSVVGYITLYLLMKYPIMLKKQVIEIKLANYKARESEEKYRSFFEMSPDYIFVIDSNNNEIIEANKAFIESMGFANFCDIKFGDFSFIENIDVVNNIEIKIPTKNGDFKEVEINSTIIKEDAYSAKILCVGRDLSEKRKIEKIEKEKEEKEELLKEALEYDKIKTEFFANMSHELRTPLNVILGSLQLVNLNLKKEGDIRESVEKNNYIIKQNCYRLLRIISNIIDITKFESNYLHIELKQLNIVSLVEDITLSVVEYARSKEIEVEFDTDVEEVYIKCDPEKVERIILNLLSNAIKFTRSGDHIFVNIYDLNDNIRICIKDTGIGIPKENLKSIFERFRQVNKSFIREHEGSGIGLSLVKSLVEMHGGEIWAKSIHGEGSEFCIDLPKSYFGSSHEDECAVDLFNESDHDLVEKISIEFSDIYFS